MKTKNIFLTFALLLCAGFMYAQNITNSAHNFTGDAWYGAETEVCKACHTPHSANYDGNTPANSPLWNRGITTNTPLLYSSTTFNATANQPTGTSKLCLSCHDGTVDMANFDGETTGSVGTITSTVSLGASLANHHPVSFLYSESKTADGAALNDISSSFDGANTISDRLFAGMVECATCHDAHDGASLGVNGKLLRMANNTSQLCLACHNK